MRARDPLKTSQTSVHRFDQDHTGHIGCSCRPHLRERGITLANEGRRPTGSLCCTNYALARNLETWRVGIELAASRPSCAAGAPRKKLALPSPNTLGAAESSSRIAAGG